MAKEDKTRSSTPDELEWDDHRHGPSSLPKASPLLFPGNRSRAPTAATIASTNVRTELSDIARVVSLQGAPPEQAVEDEVQPPHPEATSGVGMAVARVASPAMDSVGILPLIKNEQTKEIPSRCSSVSTRSHRKSDTAKQHQKRWRRGNTTISRAPSEHNASLHRTNSRSTRRRPTLSEVDHDSVPAEEDVCYPAPDGDERPEDRPINFSAIMRFIAEQAKSIDSDSESDLVKPLGAVDSGLSESSEVFYDLRSKGNNHTLDFSAETPIEVPCRPEAKRRSVSGGELFALTVKESDDDVAQRMIQLDGSEKRKSRFSFLSSRLDEPIEGSRWGDLASSEEGFRQLFNVPQEDGAHWWLDVYEATIDEIDMIAAAFYLHPLTEEDIKQQEEREKAELFKNYYFVTFRSFQIDKKRDDYMEPVQYYMVVLRGTGILTFSFHPNPHREYVQSRLLKMRDVTFLNNDWINYAIIDHIVDVYVPAIKGVEDHSDELEDSFFTARQEDLRAGYKTLGEVRKRVMKLMQLTGSKHDVLAALKKRCTKDFAVAPKHELGMYLGDVRDHVLTMMANLEHAEKMITRSQTTYQAQITMAEFENNAKLNKTLTRITLVGTLLVPLNLVTGLFGMNVPVPGRETQGLQWFFGILGMIFAAALVFILACRLKRWL